MSKLNLAFINLRHFYYNPLNSNGIADLEYTINCLSEKISSSGDFKNYFWKECFDRLFSLGGFNELAKKVSELKQNSDGGFSMPEQKYPKFLGDGKPEEVLYNYEFGKDDALLDYIENNWEDISKNFQNDKQCLDYFKEKYKLNTFEWGRFLNKRVGNISVANLLLSKNIIFYAFKYGNNTLKCKFDAIIENLKNLHKSVDKSKLGLHEFGNKLFLDNIAKKLKKRKIMY